MTSRTLLNDYYFVLYDIDDNLVCLFENYFELNKVRRIKLKELTRKFKNSNNFVNVVINNQKYKLYIFEK